MSNFKSMIITEKGSINIDINISIGSTVILKKFFTDYIFGEFHNIYRSYLPVNISNRKT